MDRRQFLIIAAGILPFLPVGYALYSQIRPFEWLLRLVMGAVVTLVAGHELWRRLVKKDDSDLPRWAVYTAPLINVYTLTRIKDKSVFRATMSAIWVMTISFSMVYRIFFLRAYSASTWTWILYALPLVIIGFLLGNKLHYKVPAEKFVTIVYSVQLISGLFSILGGVLLLAGIS